MPVCPSSASLVVNQFDVLAWSLYSIPVGTLSLTQIWLNPKATLARAVRYQDEVEPSVTLEES